MKRIVFFAVCLFAGPALADDPATIELPTPLVGQILNYLVTRPYSDVAAMIDGARGCVMIQTANKSGVAVDQGQCPAVSATIRDRAAKVAPAAPEKTQ